MRPAILALLLLALAPRAADASPRLTLRLAEAEVRYGQAHRASGALGGAGAAGAGRTVVLEGKPAPFTGGFRALARTVADARGAFRFAARLDRNYKLRARVPALGVVSALVHAYTFPAFTLTFRSPRAGRVQLVQRYTVPRAVRLTEPTLFYLGPRRARRSSLRARGETRRLRPGRYRAVVTVGLPAAWHGRFRFASCFRTTPGSGMGRPDARCPRRFTF